MWPRGDRRFGRKPLWVESGSALSFPPDALEAPPPPEALFCRGQLPYLTPTSCPGETKVKKCLQSVMF